MRNNKIPGFNLSIPNKKYFQSQFETQETQARGSRKRHLMEGDELQKFHKAYDKAMKEIQKAAIRSLARNPFKKRSDEKGTPFVFRMGSIIRRSLATTRGCAPPQKVPLTQSQRLEKIFAQLTARRLKLREQINESKERIELLSTSLKIDIPQEILPKKEAEPTSSRSTLFKEKEPEELIKNKERYINDLENELSRLTRIIHRLQRTSLQNAPDTSLAALTTTQTVSAFPNPDEQISTPTEETTNPQVKRARSDEREAKQPCFTRIVFDLKPSTQLPDLRTFVNELKAKKR